MYLDEVQTMMVQVSDAPPTENETCFRAICNTLGTFADEDIFAVFLSTNSSMTELAPTAANLPSLRLNADLPASTLNAPITEMPFDLLESDQQPLVWEYAQTLAELSTLPFMTKFGRPLWVLLPISTAIYLNVRHLLSFRMRYDILLNDNELIAFAKRKICSSRAWDLDSQDAPPAALSLSDAQLAVLTLPDVQLAVLSTKLSLDFRVTDSRAHNAAVKLVASHMRMAFSVPNHRRYLYSGTPSEPVLAEACAQLLAQWRKARRTTTPELLLPFIASGMIEKGPRGELLARVLLTDAYDRAAEKNVLVSHLPPYSQPVTVRAFLQELFTPHHAAAILASLPDNVSNRLSLGEELGDGQIRLCQWVQMSGGKEACTTFSAWTGLARGEAIICPTGYASVDLIIPVFLPNRSVRAQVAGRVEDVGGKLGEANVTAIFIQVKDRSATVSSVKVAVDAQRLPEPFFSAQDMQDKTDQPLRPYISLVLQLGIQPRHTVAKPPTKEMTALSTANPVTPSSRPLPKVHIPPTSEQHHKKLAHPRYNIIVNGCSDTIYKDVSESVCMDVLRSATLFGEHPRPETSQEVIRMRPFVVPSSVGYNWAGRSSGIIATEHDHMAEDEVVDGIHIDVFEEGDVEMQDGTV